MQRVVMVGVLWMLGGCAAGPSTDAGPALGGAGVVPSGTGGQGADGTGAPGTGGEGAPGSAADGGGAAGMADGPPPAPARSAKPCDHPPARADSPCMISDASVSCAHEITDFETGLLSRRVFWQVPGGEVPEAGYPVVFVYQGSFFGPSYTWEPLAPGVPFGGFHQGVLQARLLEAGFMVVAPEAQGGFAWQTNAGSYEGSNDDVLIGALIEAVVSDGIFGPVDADHVYATGISSGGYMTSRMAVSYPGIFRALAIQSGSYATCLGPACAVPDALPADHPPTLFLHGEADTTVPIGTARDYDDKLRAAGHETDFIAEAGIGHAWLAQSPDAIVGWFCDHAGGL